MPASRDLPAPTPRSPPAPASDDARDATTVLRPGGGFQATQVMAEATEVLPRAAADDDRDATVIRPTLQVVRDEDRTLSRGAPLRPLPKRQLALPKGLMMHEYRIERVLGQGGFGITYLATDINLDAQVAIKEYLPEEIAFRASDRSVSPNASQHRDRYRQGLENFLVEARTLASFRHPNIVRVARFFEAHDTAYMVLEYERGRSLKKWWQSQGSDRERQLLERLHPLLDGLAVVHAAGYLHRDIKPDNIQVRSEDGRFVLLDFGSAGQTVALADQDAVVVTPGYAPIEQYGVGEQGAWTDIYALGATLYWVVAGKKPPDAESRVRGATMASAVELGQGRFGPSFLFAIDWALQMDPMARPRTVDQWRDRLLADHVASLSMPAPSRRDDSIFGGAALVELSTAERVRRLLHRLVVPSAWPLATKLAVLALAAAVLVPALLLAAVRLSGVRDELQARELQKFELLARSTAGRLAQLRGDSVKLARGLAADAELARALVQGDAARDEALRQRLAGIVRHNADLQSASLVDTQGRVRATTLADAAQEVRALRPHARALAAGSSFSAPAPGGAWLVAEPVRDSGGIVAGAVLLRVAPEAFAGVVDDAARSASLAPLLIDADGVLLHHPRPELRERRLDDALLSAAMLGGSSSGSLAWRTRGSGRAASEQVAGFAQVPGSRWVVGFSAPRTAQELPLQRLAAYLWLGALLAALLLLWAALRVARGIVKPLKQLTAAAQAVRAGDFAGAEVDIKRRDEFGLLARAFNGMVDVLRQRERERERTANRR